ncbi:TetR/AcrR family transcriptional regulator [bacterium 210820-DFI.6.37]|nr:TetR/AcrR family transcriptional regulator [bacterium 210820-DFI.6.37]
MPNEAFFHLEEQKKQILLKSAISEFSSLPYEKVSIFKIAQNAGISRTSFYYYFKGKEDIYQYLLKQIRDSFIKELEKESKKYDIFAFGRKIFFFIASLKGTESDAFFRQVISDMKPEDTWTFFERLETCAGEKHFEYLRGLDGLKVDSTRELMGLAFLIASCTIFSLKSYLTDKMSLEEAARDLDKMYDMIKYGAVK